MSPLQRHYLFGFAIFGIVQPYFPLILADVGLTDPQIGAMMALFGISIFITPPALGAIADLHLQPRQILLGIYLGIAVSFALLLLAQGLVFATLATAIMALCITPAMTVTDALHFRVQHERPSHVRETPFYLVRVMGAFGFILPAPIIILLLNNENASLVSAIYLGLVLTAITIINARTLPVVRHERVQPGLAGFPTITAIRRLLQPNARWYCLAMLLYSLALSSYFAFYPLYLRDLGIEDRYIGMIASTGVFPEIILTYSFGWLSKRLGLRAIAVIAGIAMFLRLMLLASCASVPVAILSQLFHGPAILLIVVITPTYLNHIAGPSDRTSIMGVFAPLVFGLGRTFGPLVSGIFANGDHTLVFWLGGCLLTASTTIFLLGFHPEPNSPEASPANTDQTRLTPPDDGPAPAAPR